jgi:muconolactone delta-isomerase
MRLRQKIGYITIGITLVFAGQWLPHLITQDALAEHHEQSNGKMHYLVMGTGGPGFQSPEEAVQVLENIVIPSLEQLAAEKKILAGGLPVGDRAVAFIMEAASHDEADQLVRSIPLWSGMDWEVTPLQSFAGRAAMESAAVHQIRETMK